MAVYDLIAEGLKNVETIDLETLDSVQYLCLNDFDVSIYGKKYSFKKDDIIVAESNNHFLNSNPTNFTRNVNIDDIINIYISIGNKFVKIPLNLSDTSEKVLKYTPATKKIEWAVSSGGGAVDSVNAKTGVVVLTTADILDTADKKYVTDNEKIKLSNLSGTNTGDQDLTVLVLKTTTVNGKPLSNNIVLTKDDFGLSNVENTSDLDKPISTAVQTQLTSINGKITDLESGKLKVLTTAERILLVPVNPVQVFDSDMKAIFLFNGTEWEEI